MLDYLRRLPLRLGWAGLLAGSVVGLVDGLFATLAVRADAAGVIATIVLCAGVDAILGAMLGCAAGVLWAVWAWGIEGDRAAPGEPAAPPATARPWVWILAHGIVALVPTVLALALVLATATRVNRLLAGVLVALAALCGQALAAMLAPALARVLSRGRTIGGGQGGWSARVAGMLVACAAAVPVWWLVARTAAPMRGANLVRLGVFVVVVAFVGSLLVQGLAPPLGALANRNRRVRGALWIALAAQSLALVLWVRRHWDNDFQFLPWRDLRALASLVAAGVIAARFLPAARLPRTRWLVPLLGTAALTTFLAGESEVARKAAAAHAGLAAPVLAAAAGLGDWDRDGYPRWLGGGDCDDRDPNIHPGALDWPGDAIDQDCDGQDAEVASLHAPPYHPVPPSVPEDLNIVLIAIDTLRADHLGAYGYPRATSPVLDGLASEGILFENGWAHAPSTRYSMPALVTGRWPSAIDWRPCSTCDSFWPRIGDHRTMGEALKAAGYYTGAYWAYAYFDARWARGFERGIDDYQSHRALLHRNLGGPAESVGSSAREIADDGIAFMEANAKRKFFLTLHFYDPHLNYEEHPDTPRFGEPPGTTAIDRYDHEIAFTDQQIGRVLERLRSLGLWERTVIWVTGDHGEGLGERGISAHGYHLYPPQTKVPFIVRVPGLAPRKEATPIGHVDVAPTLANLARAPHEPSFLGRSMVDVLAGAPSEASPPRPWVFQEVSYENDNKKRALVTRTHQLIWNWTPHNTTECHRLADGLEGPDLWGTAAGEPECPALKRELRAQLNALSLPQDFAERLARDLSLAGKPAPEPAHALEARFGEAIRLRGYDLATPTTVRGVPVEVVLHFEVKEAVQPGWKLFVHLLGPDGAMDNLDHVPLGGAHPVEHWRAGQRLRDRFSIVVDKERPAGTYRLLIGFWRGKERLPVLPEAAAPERRFEVLRVEVE